MHIFLYIGWLKGTKMSNKIQIDASDNRISQVKQIVTAMAIKCPGCKEFQALLSDMLQMVLDHPWVDEELEADFRKGWAEMVGAEVINANEDN
jgi:hypothetical protein